MVNAVTKSCTLGFGLLAGLSLGLGAQKEESPKRQPIRFQAENILWKAGPPTLPPGSQIAVLEGDPKKSGLFTMRVRLPAHSEIGPHWHPRDERVTVLSGSVHVGFGDTLDRRNSKQFKTGAYYVNPPKIHHYVWTD